MSKILKLESARGRHGGINVIFYLKINRKEKYTFSNLQHWIHIIECIPNSCTYIICDDNNLKEAVLEQVVFTKNSFIFMESYKGCSALDYVVSNITNDRWQNAGYAHLSTFWHAKENGYPAFWNIDADDTCICLSPHRAAEMLSEAEEYGKKNKIDLFSLDMWITRTKGYHWTFGITYVNNSVDWFGIMRKYCRDENFKAGQIQNVDGYFTNLKNRTNLKIETFYAENLKFVHYADDLLRRPDGSGFFHWKEGKLILPIIRYCMGMESIGVLQIADEVVKLCMGITDNEAMEFLFDYMLPGEKERLMMRVAAEADEIDKERRSLR